MTAIEFRRIALARGFLPVPHEPEAPGKPEPQPDHGKPDEAERHADGASPPGEPPGQKPRGRANT